MLVQHFKNCRIIKVRVFFRRFFSQFFTNCVSRSKYIDTNRRIFKNIHCIAIVTFRSDYTHMVKRLKIILQLTIKSRKCIKLRFYLINNCFTIYTNKISLRFSNWNLR